MYDGWQYDKSLDNENSPEVQTSDHWAKIGQNLDDSCQGNIENDRLILIELAIGRCKIA